jgi:hypothetical protein
MDELMQRVLHILVNVVAPGMARIVCLEGDFGGFMRFDRINRRYILETDCLEWLGTVSDYREGALKLAERHGLKPEQVDIEIEFDY